MERFGLTVNVSQHFRHPLHGSLAPLKACPVQIARLCRITNRAEQFVSQYAVCGCSTSRALFRSLTSHFASDASFSRRTLVRASAPSSACRARMSSTCVGEFGLEASRRTRFRFSTSCFYAFSPWWVATSHRVHLMYGGGGAGGSSLRIHPACRLASAL